MPRINHTYVGDGPACNYCGGWRRHHRSGSVIGIDGEGLGRAPHRYVYLCAADESRKWDIENPNGLSTVACLDFILTLPRYSKIFGFAFRGYDLTMILRDLPEELIYKLYRENLREREVNERLVTVPVEWNEYLINMQNRKFSVKRGKRQTVLWDIFGFYGKKFTGALADWKVGTPEEIEAIERMKNVRSELDTLPFSQVKDYCLSECRKLSTLGRRLIQAHSQAGLELRSFHGAGSTASVILKRNDIANKRGTFPAEMRNAIARAFFGGRPENSVIGRVEEKIYGYDVSSAYPYQCALLPCLECGRWRRKSRPTKRDIDSASYALCHWTSKTFDSGSWGLLPVRSEEGTIVFPHGAVGGWCWKPEAIAASRMNPNLTFREAWLYYTDCDHFPFAEIPSLYIERLKLGKDGAGLVLKLGLNSVYGKLAQSQGKLPPFQSWIWAGTITSGTRAQLLDGIEQGGADVLVVATDGIQSRRKLNLPKPRETGTSKAQNEKGQLKPLGGWEEKVIENGLFCARPGIYFPLNPTDKQIEEVRGRGLGKKVVYDRWRDIVDAYDRGEPSITLDNVTRFIGAKTGISFGPKSGYTRSEDFGQWVDHPIKLTFDALPKRVRAMRAANGKRFRRLECWQYLDFESAPYRKAVESTALEGDIENRAILDEQPDSDIVYGSQ
jgi:hypothetical protein